MNSNEGFNPNHVLINIISKTLVEEADETGSKIILTIMNSLKQFFSGDWLVQKLYTVVLRFSRERD